MIPDNCTVLGWPLANCKGGNGRIGEEKAGLEKQIRQENTMTACPYRLSGSNLDQHSAHLDKLNKLLFAVNYNSGNESSYYKAIGNSARQAGDYYQFTKGIA